MHHPTDRLTHTAVFVRPVVENCLQWDAPWRIYPRPIATWANALTTVLHFAPCCGVLVLDGIRHRRKQMLDQSRITLPMTLCVTLLCIISCLFFVDVILLLFVCCRFGVLFDLVVSLSCFFIVCLDFCWFVFAVLFLFCFLLLIFVSFLFVCWCCCCCSFCLAFLEGADFFFSLLTTALQASNILCNS